ncbi:hypothetical protein [Asticcacaulis endophyticus]|uniref:Uncharacterized protein n=1 Tax=Asticcacaulis endophyticus TaxID=1395890 RepID=A0A918Q4F3_9CAUL|nr:hypothetical protein [Asticcacaulis endophyticus]GGZ31858.1 hypothetical protein GCM10011273_17330 [Asticcacaulis endophyticus]
MSSRDYYLDIPIPGRSAIRVQGTKTDLVALRSYLSGLDHEIETERREHAKTRALHGTACDQVESIERQLVEAKETIARLNALQRAEADRHRTTPDTLDTIEADLRRTYNKPDSKLVLNFETIAHADTVALNAYQHPAPPTVWIGVDVGQEQDIPQREGQ